MQDLLEKQNTLLVNNTIVARDSNGSINVNIMNGTATNSQSLNGSSASTAATAGTIAQRDSNKDLTARKFLGTANSGTVLQTLQKYMQVTKITSQVQF